MRIVVAKTAGFCMGVRRAVELALDAPAQYPEPIFTFGPLIHNPQVLTLFAEKGVRVLEEIPEHGTGTVLVRAHGIPPGTRKQLKQAGFKVINATCPRVIKVQSIIQSHARKGYAVVIIGDQDHPEVVGLLGYGGSQKHVVASLTALKALPEFEHAIIVAQTTQNLREYAHIKAWAAENRPHYKIFDTICDSTEKRQAEVRRIASEVDAVLVVGGKNSGNTQRLAAIVKAVGKPAYHVETEQELDTEALARVKNLGITAGASTPSWIIKRVLRSVEQIPIKRGRSWRSFWLRLQRYLLLTNVYVAFGAGCLAYAAAELQGVPISYAAMAVAVLYVMSMHILNHLTGRAENKYNDPDRARFYARHKTTLSVMAMTAGALGLVAAYWMGTLPFWGLGLMSFLGLTYNLRIVPCNYIPRIRFRSLRSFPGSKTILIALAWGMVTACLPALAAGTSSALAGFFTIVWATGLVFCRTAFFDILDVQGDRIVGKETIPILIGPKRAFNLLKGMLVAEVALLLLAGSTGITNGLAWVLIIPPLLLLWIVVAHEHGNMLPGIRMEFRVESLFVLSGLLTFIYTYLF
jgi:(E)-4-hydroxy-3-methyl-but-2-enyl pyrophosphate reductase